MFLPRKMGFMSFAVRSFSVSIVSLRDSALAKSWQSMCLFCGLPRFVTLARNDEVEWKAFSATLPRNDGVAEFCEFSFEFLLEFKEFFEFFEFSNDPPPTPLHGRGFTY